MRIRFVSLFRGLAALAVLGGAAFGAVGGALGMVSPRALGMASHPVAMIDLGLLLPGDRAVEPLTFHNRGAHPTAYDVVIIQWGDIWECERRDLNPQIELAWSAGADRRLAPGETETLEVIVSFPQAMGNACQGGHGLLVVRRGDTDRRRGRIFNCRPAPLARWSSNGLGQPDSMAGLHCIRMGDGLPGSLPR